jgi:hypothetical protein
LHGWDTRSLALRKKIKHEGVREETAEDYEVVGQESNNRLKEIACVQYTQREVIKDDEMGGAGGTHWREEQHMQSCGG